MSHAAAFRIVSPLENLADNPGPAPSQSLIDELNEAVLSGGDAQRLRILERITDLFAAGSRGYTSDQIALFDDVLQELAAEIEVQARARLAQRLAHIDNSPPGIVRWLAFDDAIVVAEPVLKYSRQLSDADLAENAKTKSQEHMLAIAQRLKLSEAVTDVLVDRGDRRVVDKVVKNKGARISLSGYEKLTHKARRDRRLTLALSRRSDLPRQYFLKLLETASASVRAKMERDNPEAAADIRGTIDEVATGIQQEVREASRRYANAERDATRRANVKPFTEANVHAPARKQEFARTAIALSKLCRFPVDAVERAPLDKGEDMILVLAKAAGCSWTTTRELLLMHVAERNLQPTDLERSFERYKKLSRDIARDVISFHGQRIELRAKREHDGGTGGG
ncbi:MAG TPA: DUF2336 domain-containing protein [Xanthobacteraceae bacterium]|jgi:hypothetical protein|nr:DUF2336 domain-containing protein [Xanthobacteraceae bacterium]